METAENPIVIVKDEGFSEKMTHQSTAPQESPSMEPQSALRSI